MPELGQTFTFSQSSFQDYADCPRRFQLHHIENVAWPAVEMEPPSEAESRQRDAKTFHRLLQQHFLGLPDSALAPLATSPDLLNWWTNFSAAGPDLHGCTLHTERSLVAPVGDHRLVAKYDLIAVRDGEAVIYDWKTHARRPQDTVLAARWQTRVYRAVLVKAGAALNAGAAFDPARVSMVYWFAEFPSQPARLSYDAQEFQRDWTAIESLTSEITGAREFPLTEELQLCRFCMYRSLCDRGRAAGLWFEADEEGTSGGDDVIDFEQISEIAF